MTRDTLYADVQKLCGAVESLNADSICFAGRSAYIPNPYTKMSVYHNSLKNITDWTQLKRICGIAKHIGYTNAHIHRTNLLINGTVCKYKLCLN